MAGNWRSGNRSSNRGRRPRTYWTVRRARQLAIWEAEQARLKEERHRAALARARAKAKERGEVRTAANRAARAAGLPVPYPERCRHGGKDKPGASTARGRGFRERRRILLAAWMAAIAEDKKRTRRLAKGLPAVPKTHAERQADYVKRKAAEKAARLANSWFSPELSETAAREQIHQTHPELDDLTIHYQYGHLAAQCRQWHLNVNNLTVAKMGEDGIERANRARAIFDVIQSRTNNPDYVSALKSADFVTDFAGLVGDINAQNKAIIRAGARWGNGAAVFRVVRAAK